MRSLLFVPADSPRKLAKAMAGEADCIIVDLEDSVAASNKGVARRTALTFLRDVLREPKRPAIFVRINALDTALSEGDLDAVVTAGPDGIVLPKAAGGSDVSLLDSRLSVREALHGHPDRSTQILPLITETAAALFATGTYAGSSRRLTALTWGAEDLSAEIGSTSARASGDWTPPFALARSLCLFAASAAGVAAIDTVYTDFGDLQGLRGDCERAAHDGFSGKLAIHPSQVAVINNAFTPHPDAVVEAQRVVAAFDGNAAAGVASLDGRMIDRPHLRSAERLIARAARFRG